MTRLITLLALLTIACTSTTALATIPATTPAPTATPAPLVCTVTADALNVRTGPGVEFAIIGGLVAGETVTVTETTGGWWQVGDGEFVNSRYLECKP